MAPYERRLEADMQQIEKSLILLGDDVKTALDNATKALLTSDHNLAYNVILGDKAVNRMEAQLKEQCYQFIVKHLPAAGHLRFVSSVMEMGNELERMGDYAVTICREAVQLTRPPHGQLGEDIKRISFESFKALEQALISLKNKDEVLAENTFKLAKLVPASFDQIYESLVSCKESKRCDLFAYLVIFNMFLRVADRTENICEELRFITTGKTKSVKNYNILFLDEDNSFFAPMAKMICQKLFPNMGQYATAARVPAYQFDQSMIDFVTDSKEDMQDLKPVSLESIDPADFYIVVSLQGPIKSYIKKMPFHSVALEWDMNDDYQTDLKIKKFEDIYRKLSLKIHDLMERLYGSEGRSIS